MLAPIPMNDPLSQLDLPHVCRTPGDQEMVDIALANGLSPRAAEAVAAIDAVMHKVRRSIQRRDFGRRVLAKLDADLDVAHLDTISAIAHNPIWSDGPKDEEVTVGLIAERLGIDPSRASRLSADVVERGYARRVASQADARRICLELTEKGERFVQAVRRNKWEVFAGALGQWSEEELVVFAALLDRFSGWATDNDGIERSAETIKPMLADAK
jgi:DNA-binding MarR family transcriptional regulator